MDEESNSQRNRELRWSKAARELVRANMNASGRDDSPGSRAGDHSISLPGDASDDSIDSMATLTIRQLDDKTKARLRIQAAHHGRSMEEEAREILRSALTVASPMGGNLAEAIRRRFDASGGVELELPRRDSIRPVPGDHE